MKAFLEWWSFCSPKFRKLLIGSVVAALLLAAFHRPLLTVFRTWRAERLVEQAEGAAEAEEWSEARRLAAASLRLRNSVEAMRVAMSAYEATEAPQLLHVAQGLYAHPEANLDDRLRSITIALDYDDSMLAARMIVGLESEDRERADLRYQVVRFWLSVENYREAFEIVDAVPPGQARASLDFLVAKELARSGNSQARGVAAARLAAVLQEADRDLALEGLRLLTNFPDAWISQPLAQIAFDRFASDKALGPGDRLGIALLRIGLNEGEREEVIASAVEVYKEDHLEALVRWLERLGENERVVDLTAPERTGELSTDVFQSRVRALAALERFEVLEAELQNPPAMVQDVPLLCCRAVLATKQKNGSQALLLWQEAMERAGRNANRNWFYQISEAAASVGNTDLAMEAKARGIEGRLGKPPPTSELADLIDWLYGRNETERLLSISYRLLHREPGNPLLINNYYYLKTLHGEATENDVRALRNLVEALPDEPAFTSSLAFALLKTNQPAEAIAVLDALESEKRPRSEQAIRAAALAALNRKAESADILATIDWDKFSLEERLVLKGFVEK